MGVISIDVYDAITSASETLKQTGLMLENIERLAYSVERGEFTGELAKQAGEDIGLYANLAEQTRFEAYHALEGIINSVETQNAKVI